MIDDQAVEELPLQRGRITRMTTRQNAKHVRLDNANVAQTQTRSRPTNRNKSKSPSKFDILLTQKH